MHATTSHTPNDCLPAAVGIFTAAAMTAAVVLPMYDALDHARFSPWVALTAYVQEHLAFGTSARSVQPPAQIAPVAADQPSTARRPV